jgi:hypothetical protein
MYISSYIMQTGSYFDFNSNTAEQIFHIFILGLVVGLRDHYHIHSNKESGLGRFDLIFIPKNKEKRGILLEFKTSDTVDLLLNKAQEALTQVKDKQYMEIFRQQFIKDVIEDTSKSMLITRPRRWGKTLNIDMLRVFFQPEVE